MSARIDYVRLTELNVEGVGIITGTISTKEKTHDTLLQMVKMVITGRSTRDTNSIAYNTLLHLGVLIDSENPIVKPHNYGN
jgi:hypothetical protein